MTSRIQVQVCIQGKVQGVFYRVHTQQEALRLGLRGWVRNMADGSVEALLEGEPDPIGKMIEWFKKGPPLARVDQVTTKNLPGLSDFKSFEITR